MKKSLLATTALAALGAVAVAGPASAAERIKIGVGGYMQQWFGYADTDNNVTPDRSGFDQQTDAEIHFKGETTLDNGLTVGVNVQLEAQQSGDQIDEQYAYVEGSFGKFVIGSENSAPYQMGYGTRSQGVTIDSGDINNWIAGIDFAMATTNGNLARQDNDSEKITYFTPRFEGFQLGAYYTPEHAQDIDAAPNNNNGVLDDGFAVGVNFDRKFNDFRIQASAGYQDYGDDDAVGAGIDPEALSFGLRLGYAGFTLSGAYFQMDNRRLIANNELETFGISLDYSAGPFGVSAAYTTGEEENRVAGQNSVQDAFELGARYNLGPGVQARGSILYGERRQANVDVAEGFAVVGGLQLGF